MTMVRHAPDGPSWWDRTPDDPVHSDLVAGALEVLDENWLGHATRPTSRLYPHQWSWDSAFISIGYAHVNQARAQQELVSLFRGQWSDGLLPHIVFDTRAAADAYFPGPDFWQTWRSAYAPRLPRTSGIVQPPIHATAAWHIYQHATDRQEAREFLEELMPWLAAWHTYLHRHRVRGPDHLVEIWHPWESGMDNSPLWDETLERMEVDEQDLPAYTRADLDHGEETERPSDWDYDRYVYLVALFRDAAYDPGAIQQSTPFAVWDVLYNTLFVRANRDLAMIARELGADGSRFDRWADATVAAMNDRLWDEEHSTYVDHDLVADERIGTRVGVGFAPFFGEVPDEERAARMVERLVRSGAQIDEHTWAVPSMSPEDPGFLPNKYWRGPVWINVNWMLFRGLRGYGYTYLAGRLHQAMLRLVRSEGFREHYDPITGHGQGEDRFAWSAALAVDLVYEADGEHPAEQTAERQ
jgi:hypothetical protein